MSHTVRKVFFAWDFEREEQWLNEMSQKGMQLVGVSLATYVFEEGKPGEYTYRLELLENLAWTSKSRPYIEFMEDSGVEHVAAFGRWAYFRKKAADGPFDIYSDLGSRIKHYKSVMTLCAVAIPLLLSPTFRFFDEFMQEPSVVGFVMTALLVTFMGSLGVGVAKLLRKIRRLEQEKAVRE